MKWECRQEIWRKMKGKIKINYIYDVMKKIKNVNKKLEKLKMNWDTMWYGFKKNKENYNNYIYNVIGFFTAYRRMSSRRIHKKK